jgi:hypothetical protein
MDNLLRACFAPAEVRTALLGPVQDPEFGVLPAPDARCIDQRVAVPGEISAEYGIH